MSNEPPIPTEREQEVFFAALEKTDPSERAAYLDAACRGQPAFRVWVENEIRRQTTRSGQVGGGGGASPGGESPFGNGTDALLLALKPEEAGDHIGPYKLVEPLGEGGFGIVWLAGQERPVRRQVALKIIRLGMNSKEIIARFSQERQALALMDHPGIAKVLDAGATTFGRPFFVMELVHGIPITDYCDEAQLSIPQRLEMFMQVCYAVQHAHQKGIIHRDIKPPNVLVTLLDGAPVPKVIDFGIAKATQQQRLTELTLVTQREFMLGTPLYMSPEQTGMSDVDIDTRSDIYSLGVLLYVLLTGRTPIDPELINQSSYDEMARIVRENELPRPSTILRGLRRHELAEVARQRQSLGPKFVQVIQGDLEWICMKALEKDRRRRYASAAAFAADIQHYLLNEAIGARPPDPWYRLRKLVSRHRRAFIVGTILFTTMLVGGVTGITETLRARTAEQRALELQQSESSQRLLAERTAAQARLDEYVSDVAFAQQSIRDGNLGRAVELLDKHRPKTAAEPDLRGFGWQYLWGLSRGDPHASFPDLADPASALAFSADGRLLAIGGLHKVIIADTHTRQAIATLPAGAGSLAFLPDNKTLLTANGGSVHFWRTDNWNETRSLPEGPGPISLSRDGTKLAVVCADGVRIHDAATWKEQRFLAGATAPIAFSPDGATLAADTPAGVTLWRIDNGRSRTLENSGGLFSGGQATLFRGVQELAFTPDGTTLFAPQNWLTEQGVFMVRAWDTRSGRETAPITNDLQRPRHTGAITSLAVSPDGASLVTTSLDHSVCLWDVAHRTSLGRLQGHLAEVGGGVFSPDGTTLVTADRLGAVYAWPVQNRQAVDSLEGTSRLLGFSADGLTLAALVPDMALVLYDAATKQEKARFPLEARQPKAGGAVVLSADLRVLAQGLDSGYVKVWDTTEGTSRSFYVANGPVDLVALTPDGQTLITGSYGKILRTHHFPSGEETYLPFSARRAVVSPNGRLLAAVSPRTGAPASDTVPNGGLLAQGSGEDDPALKDLPSTDPSSSGGSTPQLDLTTGNAINGVPIWDLRTHRLRGNLAVEVRHVLDGAFSSDGRLFVTGASDNTVQLWNTATCALVGTCTGHKQIVTAVAFAYDGTNLASASDDGTIRLWNVATQRELLTILNLGDRVKQLMFSPDDRALVAASADRAGGEVLRFYRAPLSDETD